MEYLASTYANYVVETVAFEEKRTGEKPIVLIEQYLEMDYAPDTHGTVDCCIIAGDTLTVIDNKTGFIKVTAEEDGQLNSQLAIYGLYAYKAFKDVYASVSSPKAVKAVFSAFRRRARFQTAD